MKSLKKMLGTAGVAIGAAGIALATVVPASASTQGGGGHGNYEWISGFLAGPGALANAPVVPLRLHGAVNTRGSINLGGNGSVSPIPTYKGTLTVEHGARRILEVGTLGGFSTLWLARALPSDGHLVTLELEPRHAEVARDNFVRAGLAERIDLHVAPALDTLAQLRAERVAPFDFIFIDADKANNLNYVQAAVDLSRVGTLIIVDNVVREGAVVTRRRDAAAEGVRRMAEWIRREPRLSATVIQTVGAKGYDGFLLARVQVGP